MSRKAGTGFRVCAANGTSVSSELKDGEVRAAARALYADKTAADVIGRLEAKGIDAILLKGPAVGALIDEPTRTYVDCDILVPSDLFESAEETLSEMGLRLVALDVFKHDWLRPAHTWIGLNGAEVDLHRAFVGVEVDATRLFKLLRGRTQQMEVGGRNVRVLDPPTRLLFLVLHAAKDGTRVGRPVRDLQKAVDRIPQDVWVQAAELAQELDAVGAFVAGLSLVPEGKRLLETLAVSAAPKTATLIRTQEGAPPLAIGLDWFVSQRSFGRGLSLMIHKTFPPVSFMRAWSPLARRGRLGLAAAYLWRPIWLLGKLGPAVGAWRRARRRSRQLALENGSRVRRLIEHRIPIATKIQVLWLILVTFAEVHVSLRRSKLPDVVSKLRAVDAERTYRLEPSRLGRIIYRVLRIGDKHARCLINSLVLFRLLREQGDLPELVIGLPESPEDVTAHAWIELDGEDVGPPPGRGTHQEFARYI